MAAEAISHRATAVGLSSGLGVLIPAAAYAATVPFDGVHQAVAEAALPAALGAVAGVGLLALTSYALERREAEPVRERRERRVGGAAADAANAEAQPATPKGVPVIARAAGAMTDDEAWAEIDSTFADGSPISCDPALSKDVYQIALEELQRSRDAAAQTAEMVAVQTEPQTAELSQADVSEDAAEPFDCLAYAEACVRAVQASEAAPRSGAEAEDADRDLAMRSLDGGVELTSSLVSDDLVARAVQPAPAEGGPAHAGAEPSREDIWAQALAILEQGAASGSSERPRGAHFAASVASKHLSHATLDEEVALYEHVDELVEEEVNRMRSSAHENLKGARTADAPESPRRAGRERFRVIQGGTTGVLPQLQAEA